MLHILFNRTGPAPLPKPSGDETLLRPAYLTHTTKVPSKQTKSQATTGTAKVENLHPSWQASKKRKEEQSSIQHFQGKKIKFDD